MQEERPNFTPSTAEGAPPPLPRGHGADRPALHFQFCCAQVSFPPATPNASSLLWPHKHKQAPPPPQHMLPLQLAMNFPALVFTFIFFKRIVLVFVSTSSPLYSLYHYMSTVPHRHRSYYGHQWGSSTQSCGYSSTFFFIMTYSHYWPLPSSNSLSLSPLFGSLSVPPVFLKTSFQPPFVEDSFSPTMGDSLLHSYSLERFFSFHIPRFLGDCSDSHNFNNHLPAGQTLAIYIFIHSSQSTSNTFLSTIQAPLNKLITNNPIVKYIWFLLLFLVFILLSKGLSYKINKIDSFMLQHFLGLAFGQYHIKSTQGTPLLRCWCVQSGRGGSPTLVKAVRSQHWTTPLCCEECSWMGRHLGQQGWPEVTKGPRSHLPCSGFTDGFCS